MAVTAVGRWASNSTDLERGLGDVLLGGHAADPVYLTPPTGEANRVWATSMWEAGCTGIRTALWAAPTLKEQKSVVRCATTVLRRPENLVCKDDTLVMDMRALLSGALYKRQLEMRGNGPFCSW